MSTQARNLKKTKIGVVLKKSGTDTVSVQVQTSEKHRLYGKFFKRALKYLADTKSCPKCATGDKVRIMETRPLSKMKRWRVTEILET